MTVLPPDPILSKVFDKVISGEMYVRASTKIKTLDLLWCRDCLLPDPILWRYSTKPLL